MPKKNKTRKQKIHTDERRQKEQVLPSSRLSSQTKQEQQPSTQAATFSLPTQYTTNKETKQRSITPESFLTIDTNNYTYLRKDLFKTTFLTSSILIAELLVRFFSERG